MASLWAFLFLVSLSAFLVFIEFFNCLFYYYFFLFCLFTVFLLVSSVPWHYAARAIFAMSGRKASSRIAYFFPFQYCVAIHQCCLTYKSGLQLWKEKGLKFSALTISLRRKFSSSAETFSDSQNFFSSLLPLLKLILGLGVVMSTGYGASSSAEPFAIYPFFTWFERVIVLYTSLYKRRKSSDSSLGGFWVFSTFFIAFLPILVSVRYQFQLVIWRLMQWCVFVKI